MAHVSSSSGYAERAYPDFNLSPVDINRADTTELTRIRGIGPAYSRRIFGYRNLLGGFYHPDQLLEVYGMDSVRWEQLLPQALIDTSAITKININQADYTTLLRHPYIDNNLAGALVNFRNQHSPLDSLAQIRESFLVTDEVFEKIAPYLKIK
jgi:competence protein ComEA